MVHEGEESQRFEGLSIDYMSSESSDSENDNMIVHRPLWRSRSMFKLKNDLRTFIFV